jgi:RNA polymerase sigma factor (TIGR02999 family)
MATDDGHSFTRLLRRSADGDSQAAKELVPLVYERLREIAHARMRQQANGHLLQATALVNEVLMRLCGNSLKNVRDRRHFFSIAGRAMRQILVDHARSCSRLKRTPEGPRSTIDALVADYSERAIDLLALDAALHHLEAIDPLGHELVHQHFFNGLPMEDIATLMEVPLRTLQRRWQAARLMLFRELRD